MPELLLPGAARQHLLVLGGLNGFIKVQMIAVLPGKREQVGNGSIINLCKLRIKLFKKALRLRKPVVLYQVPDLWSFHCFTSVPSSL